MIASLEALCPCRCAFVVRVHPEGGLGSPYTWAAVVVARGMTAEIKAALRAPTVSEARAVEAALRDAGFTRRWHERLSPGKCRPVSRSLQ